MAIGSTLIFDGIAWPTARVSIDAIFLKTIQAAPIFTLAASGHGRRWSTTRPLGFWRDFTEIDLADAEAVVGFVRRRGDPSGLLDADFETNTAWQAFRRLLSAAAQAWEPEDAAGISHLTADRGRLQHANSWLRDPNNPDYPMVRMGLEPVPDPAGPGFALRAHRLDTFMVVSAASALERRVAMRRCTHCRSWFEALRKDARFCSDSCRALHNSAKRK